MKPYKIKLCYVLVVNLYTWCDFYDDYLIVKDS